MMKFTIVASVAFFPLCCLSAHAQPRLPRVVDPIPPSVIEIPPLLDERLSPEAELLRLLEQELDTDAAFRDQPTSVLAPEFLNRLNAIIEGSEAVDGTIERIQTSLQPEETTPLAPEEIPVESIIGEN